jgi:hypothetical protein
MMIMEAVANNKTESTGGFTAEVVRMNSAFYRLEALFGFVRKAGITEFSSSVAEMQDIFAKISEKHPKLMAEIRVQRTTDFTTNLHSSSDLEELMIGKGYQVPLHRISDDKWEISPEAELTADFPPPLLAVGKPMPAWPYVKEPLFFPRKEDYEAAAQDLIKEMRRRA